MSRGAEQIELASRLLTLAAALGGNRSVMLGWTAIAELREQVQAARGRLLDDGEPRLIDYEAACLLEIMAELSFARADRSAERERRAQMYLDLVGMAMRDDLAIARRAWEQA